jgi:hypothetical protein
LGWSSLRDLHQSTSFVIGWRSTPSHKLEQTLSKCYCWAMKSIRTLSKCYCWAMKLDQTIAKCCCWAVKLEQTICRCWLLLGCKIGTSPFILIALELEQTIYL